MTDQDLRAALETLQSFLAASARGDREGMQRVLTRASIADGSYDNPPPPELAFLPGTPRKDGARVLIPMRLMPPGATADTPPIATFTSVLVQEDGDWKLDVIATREQPSPEMDALANQLMQQMGEALGGAMQQMGDAMQQMGQALGEALGGHSAPQANDENGDEDDAPRG
jgi:hypothetical protein